MRFWISWEERSEDYRPLTDPPEAAIIGWWCSGKAGDGSFSTICAWVEADSEEAAQSTIVRDWPGDDRVWRFVNAVADDWRPGDRFPLSDWSKKRAALEGGKT